MNEFVPALRLRSLAVADAEIACAYFVRNAARFERWEPVRASDVATYERWIRARLTAEAEGGALTLLAFARDDPGALAGTAQLDAISPEPESTALVSCSVDAAYEGRGVASALVRAIVARAGERRIGTLIAHIDPQNARSRTLFARLGFATIAEVLDVPASFVGILRPHVVMSRAL